MKAKGSCGLQEAGKEVTLPLLSLPRLGSVCMTGGVLGCAGFSLPAASAHRHVASDTRLSAALVMLACAKQGVLELRILQPWPDCNMQSSG